MTLKLKIQPDKNGCPTGLIKPIRANYEKEADAIGMGLCDDWLAIIAENAKLKADNEELWAALANPLTPC